MDGIVLDCAVPLPLRYLVIVYAEIELIRK
jgi:hypothetical protein